MNNTILALALALSLTACHTQLNPEPIIHTSLQGSLLVADTLADQYLASGQWEACVAAESVSAALTVVDSIVDGAEGIPGVSVDVSACLDLNPDFAPGNPEDPSLVSAIAFANQAFSAVEAILTFFKGDICGQAPGLFTAVLYLEMITPDILAEILSPDGVLEFSPMIVGDYVCE